MSADTNTRMCSIPVQISHITKLDNYKHYSKTSEIKSDIQ